MLFVHLKLRGHPDRLQAKTCEIKTFPEAELWDKIAKIFSLTKEEWSPERIHALIEEIFKQKSFIIEIENPMGEDKEYENIAVHRSDLDGNFDYKTSIPESIDHLKPFLNRGWEIRKILQYKPVPFKPDFVFQGGSIPERITEVLALMEKIGLRLDKVEINTNGTSEITAALNTTLDTIKIGVYYNEKKILLFVNAIVVQVITFDMLDSGAIRKLINDQLVTRPSLKGLLTN